MPPGGDAMRGVEGIRQRAFELYEARGRESGRELDDWLAPYRWMWSDRIDALERHLDTMAADESEQT